MEPEEKAMQNEQVEVAHTKDEVEHTKDEVEHTKAEVEHTKGEKAPRLMDNIKDPVYRSKLFRWMCLPIITFSMGIVDSLGGTTILDLQIITSLNKDLTSYFFTAVNLGYMLGSILGGVLYGKINSYFLMVVTTCLSSVTIIGTPYCSTFATMFLMRCILGLFMGVLLCVINTEHMQTWGTQGQALLQLINCVYAVGGVVGPLMTEPFLAEKAGVNKHNSTLNLGINLTEPTNNLMEPTNSTFYPWNNLMEHTNVTFYPWNNLMEPSNTTFYPRNNLTEPTNSTFHLWNNLTEPTNSTLPRTTNVHYAFLIAGIVSIVTIIPTFLALITPNSSSSQVKDKITQGHVDRKLPLPLKIFMIVSIFLLFFTYSCVEVTFFSFLMTFVVDQYEEVTSHQGAFITTFFWASFAACRFVSIFTSKYLSPARQLYVHLSLMVCAFSGFLVSALYSRIDILTGFTCVAGLACSANWAALISWTEAEVMKVTGPISSVILIGSCMGSAVVPIVVGYLMEHISNLWFCYCLMVFTVLAISNFVFILFFNRCYVDKKYGKLGESNTQDNTQVPQTTYS